MPGGRGPGHSISTGFIGASRPVPDTIRKSMGPDGSSSISIKQRRRRKGKKQGKVISQT